FTLSSQPRQLFLSTPQPPSLTLAGDGGVGLEPESERLAGAKSVWKTVRLHPRLGDVPGEALLNLIPSRPERALHEYDRRSPNARRLDPPEETGRALVRSRGERPRQRPVHLVGVAEIASYLPQTLVQRQSRQEHAWGLLGGRRGYVHTAPRTGAAR